MDVRMPDNTVIKNVPPGTSQADLIASYKAHIGAGSGELQRSGIVTHPEAGLDPATKRSIDDTAPDSASMTFMRGMAQGSGGNFADELYAGTDALLQPLVHNGSNAQTLGQRYDENLKFQRDRFARDAEENPVASKGGNLVGSLGVGGALTKAKGAVQAIKQGAAMGAIYGFGAGEGGAENRLISGGEGAALGAGAGAMTSTAAQIFNKVRPANISANFVNKQFAGSKMAGDSAALEQGLGQTYTPGQATGSRALLTIEGLVRRHPASADTMQNFDDKQMSLSLNNLITNLDRLHANPSGPEATGNAVAKSFDDVLTRATNVRRATAQADFGDVDKLAGAYRVIKPTNLLSTIDQLTKDFSVPGGGDASAALVKQIGGIKTALERAGPDGLSAKEAQRLLQVYGAAARGSGAIFKDMDTAQQRMIAGKLQNSLLTDLDAAADSGGHVGKIADALKKARDNYKSNSGAINDLEGSVLGRLFGADYAKAPERVAMAVKNMQGSELRQSLGILSKADPDTAQTVKRYLVEDAMNSAGHNPTSGAPQPQVAGQDTFSAAKFLTAIRKSNVWSTFTPQERNNMEMATRDLERVAFRNGTDGSPTAPLQFAWELAKAAGGGAMALSPTQVGKTIATVLVPRKIAAAITTPAGQKALRTLRIARPNTPAAAAATSTLVNMFLGPNDQGGGK